jgi:hypothetical protein
MFIKSSNHISVFNESRLHKQWLKRINKQINYYLFLLLKYLIHRKRRIYIVLRSINTNKIENFWTSSDKMYTARRNLVNFHTAQVFIVLDCFSLEQRRVHISFQNIVKSIWCAFATAQCISFEWNYLHWFVLLQEIF